MNRRRLRSVLDTNQIVGAGSGWMDAGAPDRPNCHLRLLALLLRARGCRGLYSDAMLAEYSEKLVDRGSPPERAGRLLRGIVGAFERVRVVSAEAPTRPRDPDDEVFLLCALDGDADYLVSEDGDLLSLRAAYSRPAIARCEEALPVLEGNALNRAPPGGACSPAR